MSESRLQCAPNLVGDEQDPAAWARVREAEGWPVIAAADHLFDRNRAYAHWAVTLTQMATATTVPTITSSFANNLLRSPVEFAQAALSLQRASHGRFEAGLGAGWARDEITGIGLPYPSPGERAGRYREAMTIVRALLRDGSCQFDGEFYSIDVPNIGPKVEPPILVGSLGGPRTIREITPLVDRVELKLISAATREGSLDLATMAKVDLTHLDSLVEQVRAVREDVPIGVFLMVGCGSDPRVSYMSSALGDGLMGSLVGEPEAVADAIRGLAAHGIERAQLTPYSADTIELLAPHLAAWTTVPS